MIQINVCLSYPDCNFIKNKGIANIDVFLEKEFSRLSQEEQKAQLAEYFLIAIKHFAKKYHRKIKL